MIVFYDRRHLSTFNIKIKNQKLRNKMIVPEEVLKYVRRKLNISGNSV